MTLESETYVGRRVRKQFDQGWFAGVVASTCLLSGSAERVWRIHYTDGDTEDMRWPELRAALVEAPAQGAQGAPQPSPGGAAAGGMPPQQPRYKGVYWLQRFGKWSVQWYNPARNAAQNFGQFAADQAVAAAYAYDAVVRAHGGTAVNFPRRGSGETQAVFSQAKSLTVRRSSAAAAHTPARGAKRARTLRGAAEDAAAEEAGDARDDALGAGGDGYDAPSPLPSLAPAAHARRRFAAAAAALPAQAEPPAGAGAAPLTWRTTRMRSVHPRTQAQQQRLGSCEAHESEGASEFDDDDAAADATPTRSGEHSAGALPSPLPATSPAASPACARPAGQRYKGVSWRKGTGRRRVQYWNPLTHQHDCVGTFPSDQAAARAYDAAVRAAGGTVVNFPRPGTAETQAQLRSRKSGRRSATPNASPGGAGGADADGDAADEAEEEEEEEEEAAAAVAQHRAAPPPHASPPAATAAASLHAFIRGIRPALSRPDAVAAALQRDGVTMAHVRQLSALCRDAAATEAAVECATRAVLASCGGALSPADALSLRIALARLPAAAPLSPPPRTT
jgi:hypothetical protein